jgi:hypothetical protein
MPPTALTAISAAQSAAHHSPFTIHLSPFIPPDRFRITTSAGLPQKAKPRSFIESGE